jgi:hypothetical protein
MAAARRKTARKPAPRRKAASASRRTMQAKRELIDTGTNKLFVRRNKRGTSFAQAVDVGRSLAADRRQRSKRVAKPGQGDRGDRPRRRAAR